MKKTIILSCTLLLISCGRADEEKKSNFNCYVIQFERETDEVMVNDTNEEQDDQREKRRIPVILI